MAGAQVPNPRPFAADLIERAIAAQTETDPAVITAAMLDVEQSIARRLDGHHRMERLRFECVLTWAAATFAAHLSPEQRENVYAVLRASDEALLAAAAIAVDIEMRSS